MKIPVAACMVVFCMASWAQTAPQSSASDAQSLIAKSRAVLEALRAKDAAGLNSLLADDFRSVDLAGDSGSRNEMLGSAREGFLKDFLFYSPEVLRVDDDSMLVSYNSAITLTDVALKQLAEDNLTFPRYSKVSDLWVRQGNDWKLKFEQVTPIRVMY